MITKEMADRLKSDLDALIRAANESLDNLAFCEQQREQIEALDKQVDALRKMVKELGGDDGKLF